MSLKEQSFDEYSLFFDQGVGGSQKQVKESKEKEFVNIKHKRRSKKDKTGRNYICGCGKEYLSYPALYTHIKTKHDGVQPQGTKQHIASNNKRGRPKKENVRQDDHQTIPDKEALPFSLNFISQPSQFKGESSTLLDGFVEKKDLRLIEEYNLEGSTNPTTGFPIMGYYESNKPTYHPFHVIINGLQSESRRETILSNNSCDTVMALFLFSSSKITDQKFYSILGIFFRNLRECLNEQGYQIIEDYFLKNYSEEARSLIPKKSGDKTFCEVESAEFLPLVADKFIMEYLPKFCPDFDQQLAVDIMFDFCRWLTKRKFTRIKVGFNDNEELNAVETDTSSPKDVFDDFEIPKKMFGEIRD